MTTLEELETYSPQKIAHFLLNLEIKDVKKAADLLTNMDEDLALQVLAYRLPPKTIRYIASTREGLTLLAGFIDMFFDPDVILVDNSIELVNLLTQLLSLNQRRVLLYQIKKEHAAELLLSLTPEKRKELFMTKAKYREDNQLILEHLEDLEKTVKQRHAFANTSAFIRRVAKLSPAEIGDLLLELKDVEKTARFFRALPPSLAAEVLQESSLALPMVAQSIFRETPRFLVDTIEALLDSVADLNNTLPIARRNIMGLDGTIKDYILSNISKRKAELLLVKPSIADSKIKPSVLGGRRNILYSKRGVQGSSKVTSPSLVESVSTSITNDKSSSKSSSIIIALLIILILCIIGAVGYYFWTKRDYLTSSREVRYHLEKLN